MVRFRVGFDLDGAGMSAPGSSLGELTTGPAGLLSWLESQLGLERPAVSFTERMVAYLQCLREHDNEQAFFHRSLARDEFGVAATLLRWRDTLFEAGWDGEGFDADASERLLQFGTIEGSAAAAVPPGRGQRIRAVLAALGESSPAAQVTLLDPPAVFPHAWQKLFERLGATAAPVEPAPAAAPDTDLGRLQRALAGRREAGEGSLELAGDGTLAVLRDGSPQLSAGWIARFAHSQLAELGEVSILAQRHGPTIDDALSDAGFPALGYREPSASRPAFQVLPLALELLWHPLDPVALLQFLTHPVGPVPRRMRQALAEQVARQPGIGGRDWQAVLAHALDDAAAAAGPDEAPLARDREARRIGDWLEGERFDPLGGVDLPSLEERVSRVAAWLGFALAAAADEDMASAYRAALGQAEDLARNLERLRRAGTATLSRDGVRRLVEAVRGAGTARPGRHWQCEPGAPELLRAERAAAILAPADCVIWWACDEEHLPAPWPWSRSERAALEASGARLVPLDRQLEWQARSWLRPVMAARRQLVLVLHDSAEGHHPVFDEIVAVAGGWYEERIDRLMRDPSRMPGVSGLPDTVTVAQRTIPGRQRWWRLPSSVELPKRAAESYSSLEKFLFAPHQWVLDYHARIRPGSLAELEDGSRLKGTLAHRLFEEFFREHARVGDIERAKVPTWGGVRLRELIEQEGAVLLTPGRRAELEYFVGTSLRALGELVGHLQTARVVKVEMECRLEGRFSGGGLRGAIDLIATRDNGERAVLDIKWGGLGFRLESMKTGNYLQLAVYAQLARQAYGAAPVLGYYIIRDARLLALDNHWFPQATVVTPENGEHWLEFWQRVETTWAWRRQQLEEGLVEVPVEGTEPDADSSPGDAGLAMPDTFDTFDDYRALTGWSDDA